MSAFASDITISEMTAIEWSRALANASAKMRFTEYGCCLSAAAKDKDGYATLAIRSMGRQCKVRLHRLLFFAVRGDGLRGFVSDHICENRPCVNPWHIAPSTNAANVLRGRGPCAANARKTHCIHGHEFHSENTGSVRLKNGKMGRVCRICARRRTRESEARHPRMRRRSRPPCAD